MLQFLFTSNVKYNLILNKVLVDLTHYFDFMSCGILYKILRLCRRTSDSVWVTNKSCELIASLQKYAHDIQTHGPGTHI